MGNNISKRVRQKNIKADNGLLIFSKKGDVPRFVFSDKKKRQKIFNRSTENI